MNEERSADRLNVLLNGDNTGKASGSHQELQRRSSRPVFANERLLAAWVLLSLFPPQTLIEAWDKHKTKLLCFARRMPLVDDIKDTNDRRLHICYLRLLAKVASTLENSSFDRVSLLYIILDLWKNISIQWKIDDSIQLKINIEVGTTLLIYFSQETDREKIGHALNILWSVFSKIRSYREPQSMGSSFSSEAQVYFTGNTRREEAEQMIQVIESCLDSKESDNHFEADEYNKDTWYKLVFTLFDMQQMIVSETIAVTILRWISQHAQNLSQQIQISWHKWIMCFAFKQYSQNGTTFFLRGSNEMNAMQKILLAHAVSPDTDVLRALCWQTIPVIFRKIGWKRSADSSINSPICLWSRLASGEWTITLGKEGKFTSDDKATLAGCGETLISAVRFLVSFDGQAHLPLDAAGLLHIKDSLQHAFSTASEYLARCSLQSSEPIVARVWYEILVEGELGAVRSIDTAKTALTTLLGSPTEGNCEIDEYLKRLLPHVRSGTANKDQVPSRYS
jgi:hypothetical protein